MVQGKSNHRRNGPLARPSRDPSRAKTLLEIFRYPSQVDDDFAQNSVKMNEKRNRADRDLGRDIHRANEWGTGIMGMGDAKSGQRNVAVFLDMENLVGGNSSAPTKLRLGALVTEIENIVRKSGVGSRTAVVRAYAHWGSPVMARFQREILAFGVEPVQIFSLTRTSRTLPTSNCALTSWRWPTSHPGLMCL